MCKDVLTKIIKDENGRLYTLLDFGDKIFIDDEDGFRFFWEDNKKFCKMVEDYKYKKGSDLRLSLKNIEEANYLVYVDNPGYQLNPHGYEMRTLKLFKDQYFQYHKKEWVPIGLYTEVICKGTVSISKELREFTNKFKEDFEKIQELKNEIFNIKKHFEDFIEKEKGK